MRVDIEGRIKNTQLSKSKPLLPLFEAVVNSFQAIEDAVSSSQRPFYIKIDVRRDATLNDEDMDGDIRDFVVTDNGIGFTDSNLRSFSLSDSQYKSGRGGKGLGRFMWLKAFELAKIDSHFFVDNQLFRREFAFDKNAMFLRARPRSSNSETPLTSVELLGMKEPYKEACPKTLRTIGHKLVEHCLPSFLDPKCPKVIIADAREDIDLNHYFEDNFASSASEHTFEVSGETFRLIGLRLYNSPDAAHSLMYAANCREVLTEKLGKHLPNLNSRLSDGETGMFAYLGYVEGQYLDAHVNNDRTNFTIAPKIEDGAPDLYEGITLEDIRRGAIKCVSEDLGAFLQEINKLKLMNIEAYIENEAPQYRALLRYKEEFIDRVSPTAIGKNLDAILHEEMFEKQRQLKAESQTLRNESNRESLKPEEYYDKIKSFIERENELGKSSLAQYVAHRKVIIEFLEKSLREDAKTGKYPLEEVVHKIIYPMRTTSDDVPYDQQNLWIIDERLSYHSFLASDVRLDKNPALSNDSNSRPDIMVFNHALTFAEDEAALNSVVIVEFKKPGRRDYRNEDPVEQVYRMIREIKTGHFKDKDGVEIKVQSNKIPVYAYVICDTTPEIEIIAAGKNLIATPDNMGYYGYNSSYDAYIEIISYKKLLTDAKKRNRILFEKLNLPSQM